jgi:malate synthase
MTTQTRYAEGIQITGPITPEFAEILTPEAMDFVAQLIRTFAGRREELLRRRVLRLAEIDAGKMPDFLSETEDIRKGDWTVAPLPQDLLDRRVEITGLLSTK